MAIDPRAVKQFWDWRAQSHKNNSGLTNLEEDPALRELKVRLEEEKIKEYITLKPSHILLDLGGGNGYWAFKFAAQAKHITVVDYCEDLVGQGKKAAEENSISNVTFVHERAQDFNCPHRFDVIFISGLLIYLNDDEFEALISHIVDYSKPGTEIILRDGTAVKERSEIKDKYSAALKTHYSALYRTREEYIPAFEKIGFSLVRDENMFSEGCVLNKFPETRLRIYKFQR